MDADGYVVVDWAGEENTHPIRHFPHDLYKVESEDENSQSESGSSGESSESEAWETASEDGHHRAEGFDENHENSPPVLIASAEPSEDQNEEAASPTSNVDIEALNNANNIENQVDSVESGTGRNSYTRFFPAILVQRSSRVHWAGPL